MSGNVRECVLADGEDDRNDRESHREPDHQRVAGVVALLEAGEEPRLEVPRERETLELMEGSARWSIDEGYAAEEDAIAELLPSRQAQASLYAFDLVERRAKKNPGQLTFGHPGVATTPALTLTRIAAKEGFTFRSVPSICVTPVRRA